MKSITATMMLVVSVGASGVWASGTTGEMAGAAAPLPALLARIDQLHHRRDDPAALAEEQRLALGAVSRSADNYQLLWRAARVMFWLSDDPSLSSQQRSKLGKEGWDLAERAVAANPNDVAGQYYAAVCMGNYALGLGVVKALAMGMETKFKERLRRAGELDRTYLNGSIWIAWGRFYDKLPWPKRDRKKAQESLREALLINPHSLRARVFLASSLMNDDHPRQAKALLEEVAAATPGQYDAPEERRSKGLGASLMPELLSRLK